MEYKSISEKDSTDVNQFLNTETDVLMTSGRTNWFTINHNIVIKDVRRVIFHNNGKIELQSWNNDDRSDLHEIRVNGVFNIVCDGVYWSKKVEVSL